MSNNNQNITLATSSPRAIAPAATTVHDMGAEVNYSEIPGLNSPTVDVLNQFQANLKLLGDLHFKLQFVLGEIKTTAGVSE